MSDDAVRPRRALESDDTAEEPGPDPQRDDSPFARPARSATSPARSADSPYSSSGASPARSAASPQYSAGPPSRSAGSPARRSLDFDDDDPTEIREAITEPMRGLDFGRRDPALPPAAEAAAAIPPPTASPETMIPAPVLPPRGEGYYEGPGPRPRRSALSSSTPPEAPPQPATPSPESARSPEPAPIVAAAPGAPPPPARQGWFAAHGRSFLVAGLAIAVLALAAGIAGYLTGRAPQPAVTPSVSPSPTDSPTSPRVDVEDLLTEADAKAISAGATWATTNTTTTAAEHPARPACFSTEPSGAERLDSLQRTLGTTEENQLAVLHQLDAYPSVEAAQAALAERAERMARCDEVPMRIVHAAAVTGLAEETYQISVVHEGEQAQYHNLLLARAGNILSITDTFSTGDGPVSTGAVVEAMARPLEGLCERVGSCSAGPVEVTAKQVPPVEPRGWLIPSDLPRIRPGEGRWTAQTPSALTSPGNGCEDMTLATVSGPVERAQNTYLVTQDEARPDQFGLDEMVFVFGSNAAAADFAAQLSENLATCGERVLGTEVSPLGVGDQATAFDITREIEGGEIAYQVAVVLRDHRVAYLLATVSENYRFDAGDLGLVAQRASVRLPQ